MAWECREKTLFSAWALGARFALKQARPWGLAGWLGPAAFIIFFFFLKNWARGQCLGRRKWGIRPFLVGLGCQTSGPREESEEPTRPRLPIFFFFFLVGPRSLLVPRENALGAWAVRPLCRAPFFFFFFFFFFLQPSNEFFL